MLILVMASVAVTAQDRLTTTSHPALPGSPSQYWIVPDATPRSTGRQSAETAAERFARGAKLIAAGDFAAGLPLVSRADLAATPLAHYSLYYSGVALQGLKRTGEADAVLTKLTRSDFKGYLEEAAPLRLAEVALAGDPERATDILEDLSDEKITSVEEVLLRLGAAEEAAGNRDKALAAYYRVYFDYPLSTQSADAQSGIERLVTPALLPPDRFKLELARAEKLFAARRWAQARAGFVPLARVATGAEKELVALRLAECDYYLNRHRESRDALLPFIDDASREAEARFFHLTATRGLGDRASYLALARDLVDDHSSSSWAEETLNNLASHHITLDEDEAADRVFRELVRRFPRSRYGDRAAWKIGWWAYKNDRFAEAAETFEAAASAYPRADFRPSWLYWAARARDQMGEAPLANARYRIVAADYFNSYYGRLSSQLLASRREPPVQPIVAVQTTPAGTVLEPVVPTEPVIRQLVSLELYDDALNEVQYAQRAWGDSPALQATVAWIRNRRGLTEKANDRFADVRGAITIMRRAYPQFLAAGGENLPPDVLRVIFPMDYWPLIKKYSEAHGLDPYLMAALISQESTFTPDVRSSANATGLMQLMAPTARSVSRQLGIRYNARMLTQPESNIRLGMKYFKSMVDQFGGAYYALAGYNAGPHRVVRWKAERPGFEQDEFIDDIPFQETQNYVKRILGTADDYRRLYGGGILSTTASR